MMNHEKKKPDAQHLVHMHLSAIRTEMVDLAFNCRPKQAQEAALPFIHTAEAIARALEGYMDNIPWCSLAARCRHATENMRLLRSIF